MFTLCRSSLPRLKSMQGDGDVSKPAEGPNSREGGSALISMVTVTRRALGPDSEAEG